MQQRHWTKKPTFESRILDANGSRRGSTPLSQGDAEIIDSTGRANIQMIDDSRTTGAYETWGASGLTGVWAEENSREAIYKAFRRKETFATSGPRMKLRLFAGYGFDADMLDDADGLSRAYQQGVSMGSDLLPGAGAPSLLAWATRDPNSAPLQRLQIIKGWTVNGEHNEQVYDVACSDGGQVDPTTHRCPDNGAKVDISNCDISQGVGSAELKAA